MKVGDKCYLWDKYQKRYKEVEVTSVGRKYFTISNVGYSGAKFLIENGYEVSECNPVRVYPSVAAIREHLLWSRLRDMFNPYFRNRYNISNVSLDVLKQVASLLGILSQIEDSIEKEIGHLETDTKDC